MFFDNFDNDGFEITPSFEEETSDNNTSDNIASDEEASEQPTVTNERASHNKRYAQRRIEERDARRAKEAERIAQEAEQAKWRAFEELKAQVATLTGKPKEEEAAELLERFSEDPNKVLDELLEKKLASQAPDPELVNEYVETRFFEPMFDDTELAPRMEVFEGIQKLAQVDPNLGFVAEALEKHYKAVKDAFLTEFNRATNNGRNITPLIEAKLQHETKGLIKEALAKEQQFFANNPQIEQYIIKNHVEPYQQQTQRQELPKNTRQIKDDAPQKQSSVQPSSSPYFTNWR